VLTFFMGAVRPILRLKPNWIGEQVLALDKRMAMGSVSYGRNDELLDRVVALLLHLWLVYDLPEVGARVHEWLQDPLEQSNRLGHALSALREALVQGDADGSNPTDGRVRSRALEVFEAVVTQLAPTFGALASRSGLSSDEQKQAETMLRLLDRAATEVYFGSGAHAAREGATDSPPQSIRRRFLVEAAPTLRALA